MCLPLLVGPGETVKLRCTGNLITSHGTGMGGGGGGDGRNTEGVGLRKRKVYSSKKTLIAMKIHPDLGSRQR